MTVIINGTVDFNPQDASAVMLDTADLMARTRTQKGCRHYVWSLDPAVPGRVYVYENWQSTRDLAAHLQGHFYTEMLALVTKFEILGTDILKYRIDHAEPVYDESGTPRADFFTSKTP
jgi:quinol monooxygenase YgiN